MSIQGNSHIYAQEINIIAKGAGIVFIGTIIGTILKYLFELIVARNLGAGLFGLFFLGMAVLKITEIISSLGLHRGVLRYVALFRGEVDEKRTKGAIVLALRIVTVVGIIVGLSIFILSKFAAVNIFHKIDLTNVLRFFAIAIPFTALTTILVFSTQGFKIVKYRIYVREIFEPAIRIIVVIIMFTIGWELFGAIFAFIVSIMIGTFLAFYYLKSLFPKITSKNTKPIFESRKILDFSLPLLFAEFLSLIIIWINILMIGYFRTSQEVGIYSAAHRTALLGQIILISFNSIFAPIIADLYNKKEYKKLESLFKLVTKWIFALTFPICLLMIFFASGILNLFGKNFIAGTICLVTLSVAQLINSVIGSSGFMIMMSGKSRIILLNNIIVVSLNISLNLFLIPKYGILGGALSFLISVIFINVIMLIEVYLIFKLHPFKVDLYKALLAGVISLFILILITRFIHLDSSSLLNLALGSMIFLITYVLITYLLGIGEEEKIILQKIRLKVGSYIKGENYGK